MVNVTPPRMSSRHSPACSMLTDFRRGECHSGAGHALGFVIMVAAFFISKSAPMHHLSLWALEPSTISVSSTWTAHNTARHQGKQMLGIFPATTSVSKIMWHSVSVMTVLIYVAKCFYENTCTLLCLLTERDQYSSTSERSPGSHFLESINLCST